MSADRLVILSWLSDRASSIVRDDIDRKSLTARIAAAPALDAGSFAEEVLQLMRIIAESVSSPEDFYSFSVPAGVTDETRSALQVLVAIGLAIAGGRVAWPSRPAARSARSWISKAGDDALASVSAVGDGGALLYGWVSAIVAIAVRVVSQIAANSVPIVRVEADISLPSTALAYRLYGDANRAQGLTEIAQSSTPMLMPITFDALAR